MTIQTARHLRKTLTPQEVKIWNHLRTWRSQGFHFRRQAPRLGYIVDFICLKHHLLSKSMAGNITLSLIARLTKGEIKNLSVRVFFIVLRFWNSDVDGNLAGVLETIQAALNGNRPHQTAFGGHPPPKGEG